MDLVLNEQGSKCFVNISVYALIQRVAKRNDLDNPHSMYNMYYWYVLMILLASPTAPVLCIIHPNRLTHKQPRTGSVIQGYL